MDFTVHGNGQGAWEQMDGNEKPASSSTSGSAPHTCRLHALLGRCRMRKRQGGVRWACRRRVRASVWRVKAPSQVGRNEGLRWALCDAVGVRALTVCCPGALPGQQHEGPGGPSEHRCGGGGGPMWHIQATSRQTKNFGKGQGIGVGWSRVGYGILLFEYGRCTGDVGYVYGKCKIL